MKTIAVVPARGGSKRIPHKNIVDFMGKPLIAWTLQAARDSGIFDRILVSTDDDTIAATVQRLGFEVPFLRREAADDHTPVSGATVAALRQAREHWKEEYDVVVQLMPNCPLRGADDIRHSHQAFLAAKADFQISCFKFGWMNPWWAVRLNGQGVPEPVFPDAMGKRGQDLPDLYCPTGAIWIARAPSLEAAGTFYGQGHRFHPIEWKAAVDIDNYEDLEFAKAVFGLMP